MTQVTPNDILKGYPIFKVCTQVKPTDNVLYRDIRCPDMKELLIFLERLLNPVKMKDLAFFEVHQVNKDGTVAVLVGDANRSLPKDVPHETLGGIITPKIPQPDQTRSQLPPIIKHAPTEPAPRRLLPTTPEAVAAIVKMKADKLKEPDEVGRPTQLYKSEVA